MNNNQTCPTCNQLRATWYATATIIPADADPERLHNTAAADRATDAYREAKQTYVKHLRECGCGRK